MPNTASPCRSESSRDIFISTPHENRLGLMIAGAHNMAGVGGGRVREGRMYGMRKITGSKYLFSWGRGGIPWREAYRGGDCSCWSWICVNFKLCWSWKPQVEVAVGCFQPQTAHATRNESARGKVAHVIGGGAADSFSYTVGSKRLSIVWYSILAHHDWRTVWSWGYSHWLVAAESCIMTHAWWLLAT